MISQAFRCSELRIYLVYRILKQQMVITLHEFQMVQNSKYHIANRAHLPCTPTI